VFDLEWPDPDRRGTGRPTLDVWFQLNVDIFSPSTGGANRDNRVLASLNGPRLKSFLHRLRAGLGAELVDVDRQHGGEIGPDGYLPAPRES
jgi:hypothetical protein